MSGRLKLLLILVLVAGVIIGSYWKLSQPQSIVVSIAVAEAGLVEKTIANTRAGTIEACRRTRLSPSIGGQIAVLNVEKGDQVRKGDLLMSLWNKDLMAEIELSQAESKSALANARATCLNAEAAQREASRLMKLKKGGAVSEESVDRAVTDASARRASCDAANASAEVSASRAKVSRARLDRTRLVAPFDGVIADINGELSEYVTPSSSGGSAPAIDLIDTTCFHVTAPIDEVDASRIVLGQPARVTLDAFGDRLFNGIVKRIAPFVLDLASQARTVEIEVELTNPADLKELLAGYSADVEVILDAHIATVRIPSEAILENRIVFVLVGDVLKEREIITGISNWGWTEVVSGVDPGDLVVISIDQSGVEDGALASVDTDTE